MLNSAFFPIAIKALVGNYYMVDKRYVHNTSGSFYLLCQSVVFFTWFRMSRWMIVRQRNACGICKQRFL